MNKHFEKQNEKTVLPKKLKQSCLLMNLILEKVKRRGQVNAKDRRWVGRRLRLKGGG